MTNSVISVDNLSKKYQLGLVGTGSFGGDLKRWWARKRRLPDPYRKIGENDHSNRQGDTVWALKDINFDAKHGEALGIIGSNGAGKSTLLKILSQITAPSTGTVKVKGRIASLLEVGTGFHPELTGRENVYLNGTIMGMKRIEIDRKFDEIVEFSGVEKFIDTPVKRYSSGMFVRLAFAVAAHLEPDILVVDEVLSVGDLRFQKKSLGKMQQVSEGGRTVLFVSHAMDSVRKLCSQCILLDKGKMLEMGDTGDVIHSYLKMSADKNISSYWKRKSHEMWSEHKEYIPLELTIETGDGRLVSSVVGSSNDIWIRIVGEIREIHPNLVVGFALYNANDTLIFESSPIDMAGSKWIELRNGIITLRVPLPCKLINAGSYRVQLQVALHQMRWLIPPGAGPSVSFDLVIDHADSAYSGYTKRGVIVPVLDWEVLT